MKIWFHILISLSLVIENYYSINVDDFYEYKKGASVLSQQYESFDLVKYPHWSDQENTKITIVSSGVVRLSGINEKNTLDVLIYAISLPGLSTDVDHIYYKYFSPDNELKDKIIDDLNAASIDTLNFTPIQVFLVTWVKAPFTLGSESTFQMAFVTNAIDTTYLIAQIDQIDPSSYKNGKFPEFDLRYAYDDGSRATRSNFLFKETGTATKTAEAMNIATTRSNCGIPGRWILNLSEDPTKGNEAVTTTPILPTAQTPKKSDGFSVQGRFVFSSLSVNGLPVTNDNDALNVILTKKNKQYEEMTNDIQDWISDVYKQSFDSNIKTPKILNMRTGSLEVIYYVSLDDTEQDKVCKSISPEDCKDEIDRKVKNETAKGIVTTVKLDGILDQNKTSVNDFDECSEPPGVFCDVNAICIDNAGQYSYSCVCKDGYEGDGFPGNCKKIKDSTTNNTILIVSIVVAALFIIAIIISAYALYDKSKKHDKLREEILKNAGIDNEIADYKMLRKRAPKQNKKKSILKEMSRRSNSFSTQSDDWDVYYET